MASKRENITTKLLLIKFVNIHTAVVALGKGGPVQIKWWGPFLYTPL